MFWEAQVYWREVVLAVVLLLLWTAAMVVLYMIARTGRIWLQLNLLALAGALLGFCSFMIGWAVVERGFDCRITTDVSYFLLLSYPFTLATPFAGLGNATVLLYAISFANEVGGAIEAMSAYLLGWLSVAVLIASMIVPIGLKYDGHWELLPGEREFLSCDRWLTLHFKRMSAETIRTLS